MTSQADGGSRRDPVRTRRALLGAAAEAVASHGSGVSLEAIARTAGVSKSGLLHHFSSKEELFATLADDAYARFELDIAAYTEPADLAPGRALCKSTEGVRDDHTLHAARHSTVTFMRNAGVPDHIVAAWHGHDEVVMRRTYSHVHNTQMRTAGSALAFGATD